MIRALHDNSYGWLVVGVCFAALMMTYAARSSLGLMIPFWETDPGWSRDLASNAGALSLVLMAVVSPFAGNLIDRFGPRQICALGLACVGAAVLATAASTTDWELIAFYGALIGIGSGMIAMPMVSAAVAHHFATGRGLATGIGFSGATGGQLVALPVLGLLVVALGWRATYTAMGVAIVGMAVVAFVVLRGDAPRLAAGAAQASAPFLDRLRYVFASGTFWLLLAGFTICGFTTAGVIEVHLLPYASICGFAPIEGAMAYGVHGGANMAGIILSGFLADRLHRPIMLASIYFIRAALFFLLLYVAGSLPLLFAFAALYGFLSFATTPVIASLVADRLGVGVMGLAMGLIFGGHWLGASAGAYLGGYLYGQFARYEELWQVSIVVVLAAGLLTLFIPENRRLGRAAVPA